MMDSIVLNHEPELALFVSDEDPLVFYRSISKAVYPYLSTNGSLYFECHYIYLDKTREMLFSLGFNTVEKRQDLQGKWRMLKAQKS
jgi:release factor glutamine methyltransferase